MMNTTFLKLNLQLFATQTTLLGSYSPSTTTIDGVTVGQWAGSGLAVENKAFYDMTLIDEATPNLVHEQFGQKKPIPKNGGKTIEFRKFAPLAKALTALTEGVTPAGNSLEAHGITATVKQYGDFIVQSDLLELTAIDNTIVEATKLLGQQAGLTLDTIVRNILHTGTNVSYAHKISGSTETEVNSRLDLDKTAQLTVDEVMQVVAKLRAQNAPTINGMYVAIIHPYVAYDLMRDPEWIDAHKYANPTNLYSGEIGEIGGVRFVQTTEAKIVAPKRKIGNRRVVTNASAISTPNTTTITINETDLGGLATTDYTSDPIPCLINGAENTIKGVTLSSGTYTLTIGTAIDSLALNAPIAVAGGTKTGEAVFCSLFMGANAYGVTEINGGGLQTIIKQKGSAGTADPLDQRSSIGWKALKTAEILVERYMVRVESCSKRYSDVAEAN